MPICTRSVVRSIHATPGREIELHLTGNMERFMWSFDGAEVLRGRPLHFRYGERLRIVLVNDTMMTHPIHLHGMWSEMEAPDGDFQVRKHTVNVQPAQRVAYLVNADAPGPLGLSLPFALSHGSGDVPRSGGVVRHALSQIAGRRDDVSLLALVPALLCIAAAVPRAAAAQDSDRRGLDAKQPREHLKDGHSMEDGIDHGAMDTSRNGSSTRSTWSNG